MRKAFPGLQVSVVFVEGTGYCLDVDLTATLEGLDEPGTQENHARLAAKIEAIPGCPFSIVGAYTSWHFSGEAP